MSDVTGQLHLPITKDLAESKAIKLKLWQEVFCQEYAKTGHGTRSYLKARPEVTEITARVNSSKLLSSTNIKNRVAEYRQEIEDECKALVIGFNKSVIEFDPSRLFTENGRQIELHDKSFPADIKTIAGMDTKIIDGSLRYIPTFPTTGDKHRSAESLAKIMAMNKEQVTIDVNSGLSDIERAAKLTAILDAARARATGQPSPEGMGAVAGSAG